MNAIVCELCGSNDIVKQDGVYVCQHCGTKYTPEEAKKLMVEGTVDVTGSTVKIDSSERVKSLLSRASDFEKINDYSAADELYMEALHLEPDCKEAFEGHAKIQKKYPVTLVFGGALGLYPGSPWHVEVDGEGVTDYFDVRTVAIFDKNLELSLGKHVFSMKTASGSVLNSYTLNVNSDPEQKIYLYSNGGPRFSETPPPQNSSSSGGCYVATAVYGSYDCPQVWTLRRYRDNTLAETWYGRAFIRTYYAISPTLVKWFGKTDWFKNLWKPKLDRMVERLNSNGVADTPYNDRTW